jgi:hypothetical protein
MRRVVIALLSLIEAAVGCGILASSLALSRDLQANEAVGRMAHAVVDSTREIAFEVRTSLHRHLT